MGAAGKPEAGYTFQQNCVGVDMCPRNTSHRPIDTHGGPKRHLTNTG